MKSIKCSRLRQQLLAWLAILLLFGLDVLIPSRMANALPITSKPIENTAENLAWQAWLMLPPEQKSQEKSRKVTPKSIFTLPFRECPPGHQLYETLCIPTVNIDQTQLLTQQLLGIVVGNIGAGNNYEFDYDDVVEPELTYETPQQMHANGHYNDDAAAAAAVGVAAQSPPSSTKDEPLKFNIFQQKFPTDYESESVSNSEAGSGEGVVIETAAAAGEGSMSLPMNQTNNFNSTDFLDALNAYLQRHAQENNNATLKDENQPKLNATTDMQMEGTNNFLTATTMTDTERAEMQAEADVEKNSAKTQPPTTTTFAISDIQAIVLPATTGKNTGKVNLEFQKTHVDAGALVPTKMQQKISLYQQHNDDDAAAGNDAVQLVTAYVPLHKYEQEPTQLPENIKQLLKVDALLPLFNITQNVNATSKQDQLESQLQTIATSTTTSKAKTMLSKRKQLLPEEAASAADYDDVLACSGDTTTLLSTPKDSAIDTTTTTTMLADDATVLGPLDVDMTALASDELMSELLEAVETKRKIMPHLAAEEEEEEMSTRSAAKRRETVEAYTENGEDVMGPQEIYFTTTLEPEGTTNMELDDTTIIEAFDPPTIELQELQATQHSREQAIRERVRQQHVAPKKSKVEPVDELALPTAAAKNGIVVATTSTTHLPANLKPTTTTTEHDDQFYYQQHDYDDNNNNNNKSEHADSNIDDDEDDSYNRMATMQSVKVVETASSSSSSRNKNNKPTATTSTAATTRVRAAAESEIDIEKELRLINELVKGKRRPTIKTATATTTTTTTTAAAAKIITTVAPAAASNFDKETSVTAVKTTPAAATTTTTATRSVSFKTNKKNEHNEESTNIVNINDGDDDNDNENDVVVVPDNVAANVATIQKKNKQNIAVESSAKNGMETLNEAKKMAHVEPTTTTITEIITTTTLPTPTATLWSKIMPIFGFATAAKADEVSEATTPEETVETEATTVSKLISKISSESSISISSSSSSASSISSSNKSNSSINNRSHRNSKISKLNNIDTTTTTTTKTSVPKTTTNTLAAAEQQVLTPENQQAENEPFWWLPLGWRLDRSTTQPAEEQNLLLRFWSTFPSNHAKVEA